MDAATVDASTAASGRAFDRRFEPGEAFGSRYKIIEEIGAGGMGRVYKAIDLELQKTVALKLILPSIAPRSDALDRFRQELALAQDVTHPNVCRVYDMGEVEGSRYISMEYLDGQSLRDWISLVGRFSAKQTISIGRQICAGLQAIHDRSIMHRDLKPANIVVSRAGRAALMDFGIAQRFEPEAVGGATETSGTPAYLAPEQTQSGISDQRTEVYSLGLVLFEMLTGRRAPGDESQRPLAYRPADEVCPPPSRTAPEVPPALDAVVLRCLERDPRRRYASVRDLSQALAEAEKEVSGEKQASLRKRRVISAAVLAIVGVLALLAGYSLRPQPAAAGPITVACLPLAYAGPEESAYLGQLLPLLVSDELRGSDRLEVAPFAASRSFQPQEDPRSVARQLAVRQVLCGNVRVRSKRFDAELRLISADPGQATWTHRISGPVADLLAQIDPLAATVGTRLGVEIQPQKQRGADLVALGDYLEGKKYLEGWDVGDNYARAADAFSRALEKNDRFAEAYAGLALALWRSYLENHDPLFVDRADRAARRAVELSPNLPEAHLAVGVVELGRGRSLEAEAAFRTAQRLAPADDEVCRRIADAYAKLGKNREAEVLYQRAIDLRPTYWEHYNNKGLFYLRTGEFDQAARVFRKVIELRPESYIGYLNLSATQILAGQLSEAEPVLLAALKLAPTAEGYNNLGFVYYSEGRFEEAAAQWVKAIELDPEYPPTYVNLGDAYRHLSRQGNANSAYQRASELCRKQLQINPADNEMRMFLSLSLAGLQLCTEAETLANDSMKVEPENPTFHYYAAVTFAICGSPAQATRHIEAAVKGGAMADVKSNPDLRPFLSSEMQDDLAKN